MRVFAAIAVFLGVSSAFSIEDSFAAFKDKYGKSYKTAEEHSYRLSVYAKNLEFIESHNRKNLGFSVAINQFADLTNEEFRNTFNGYRQSNETRTAELHAYNPLVQIPDSVDWRSKGVVTPIKDQGQCGSCWSFSAVGSIEGQHALRTGKLVSLSEQNIVDCSSNSKYGNEGCNGGLMDAAFRYVIANKGDDTEASYPYEAKQGTCRFKSSTVGATISSYKDIPSGNENSLANAVATVGPVSVAIDASHNSFQFYSSGVYYESACSTRSLDHGVLVVGYGVDNGKDYWLVKNSWGTSWGIKGYIQMSKDRNNNCGIATTASYPVV